MRARYELTCWGRLGLGETDDKEATILNRVIRWTERGLEYEADPHQGEKLVHGLGLDEGTNGCATLGVKAQSEQVEA